MLTLKHSKYLMHVKRAYVLIPSVMHGFDSCLILHLDNLGSGACLLVSLFNVL